MNPPLPAGEPRSLPVLSREGFVRVGDDERGEATLRCDLKQYSTSTNVCIYSFGASVHWITISYMSNPSTDTQTFSTFAALNRADLTHEPRDTGKPWIGKFVIAGVILVVVLGLVVGGP